MHKSVVLFYMPKSYEVWVGSMLVFSVNASTEYEYRVVQGKETSLKHPFLGENAYKTGWPVARNRWFDEGMSSNLSFRADECTPDEVFMTKEEIQAKWDKINADVSSLERKCTCNCHHA